MIHLLVNGKLQEKKENVLAHMFSLDISPRDTRTVLLSHKNVIRSWNDRGTSFLTFFCNTRT